MARNKKHTTPAKQSLIDLANKQLAREKKQTGYVTTLSFQGSPRNLLNLMTK
jgi:hypothetical protein